MSSDQNEVLQAGILNDETLKKESSIYDANFDDSKKYMKGYFSTTSDDEKSGSESSTSTKSGKSKKRSKNNGGSILSNFIKNLRPGMDLVSITCPTFILRPYSFLEVRADFSTPTEDILNINSVQEPDQRILKVTAWMLSGLSKTIHYGFRGLKPYNPILGEKFVCQYEHKDSTTNVFSEQVSHHPPLTSLYMENRVAQFTYEVTSGFTISFSGNSVTSGMKGKPVFTLMKFDEKYEMEVPAAWCRGILWGQTVTENYGPLIITCAKTGYTAKIESKGKTTNHLIKGSIVAKDGEKVYDIEGSLIGSVTYKDTIVKEKKDLIDIATIKSPKKVLKPVYEQEENESRRVWHTVTVPLVNDDFEAASKAKHAIEERQRALAKINKEEDWKTVMFKKTDKTSQDIPVYEYVNKMKSDEVKELDPTLVDLD